MGEKPSRESEKGDRPRDSIGVTSNMSGLPGGGANTPAKADAPVQRVTPEGRLEKPEDEAACEEEAREALGFER